MLPLLVSREEYTSSEHGIEGNDQTQNTDNGREKSEYQVIGEYHEVNEEEPEDDKSYEFLYSYHIEEKIYRSVKHPNLNLTLFSFCYIMFLLFGALIFMLIEQPQEVANCQKFTHLRENFLIKYPFIKAEDLNNLLETVLKMQSYNDLNTNSKSPSNKIYVNHTVALDEVVVKAPLSQNSSNYYNYDMQQQGSLADNQTNLITLNQNNTNNNLLKWKFSSSLLFVTSIVTTIGYGNISPSTDVGKMFCIFFGSIGIPATLTLLSIMVAHFIRGPVKSIEAVIINTMYHLIHHASLFVIRFTHLVIVSLILLIVCFLIPAYFFFILEDNWSYLDCLYYCFVSLTSIGLGDLIPASNKSQNSDLYIITTIFYLYFGLSLLMLWLTLVYRIPQFNLHKMLVSSKCKHDVKTKERLRILINNAQPRNFYE